MTRLAIHARRFWLVGDDGGLVRPFAPPRSPHTSFDALVDQIATKRRLGLMGSDRHGSNGSYRAVYGSPGAEVIPAAQGDQNQCRSNS